MAFYEPKNMFAILFEDRLEIAKLSMQTVTSYQISNVNWKILNGLTKITLNVEHY